MFPKVGTNNHFTKSAAQQRATTFSTIIKVQRNKEQRLSQPLKAQCQMRSLIFFSEAQRKFHTKLFNSVEAQRNPAITEPDFRPKLKRNRTSATKFTKHLQIPHFCDFKEASNLQKKIGI